MIDGKDVYIGGDSAAIEDYDLIISAVEKVFRNGPVIVGVAGSWRSLQLLQYQLSEPHHPAGMCDAEYMSTAFVDEVRKCFKAGGCLTLKDNIEVGERFIVGYHGCLYRVYEDFQVAVAADPFCAIGCGESYAHAALWVNHKQPKLSAKAKVVQALKAAEHFSAGVRGPFKVIKLSG